MHLPSLFRAATRSLPLLIACASVSTAPATLGAERAIMPAPAWLGMNMGYAEPTALPELIADFRAVGLQHIRLGGNALDDPKQDEHVDLLHKAGITIHWVLIYRGNGINPRGTARVELPALAIDGPVMERWFDNYKARCRALFERYSTPGQEKILYYIVGNEPNLKDNHTSLHGRPDVAVRLTQAMFEAAREVNDKIIVQSSPVSQPDALYLREMLQLGLAKYCDVIGTHVYGGQINPTRLGKPWEWQAEVGSRLPVASSESGVTVGWTPKGIDGRQWQSDWIASWYVMCHRMGYRTGTLFTHDDDHHADWALMRTSAGPIKSGFDRIAQFRNPRQGLDNTGFEQPNDPLTDWSVERDVDQAALPDHFEWNHPDAHSGRFAARARGDARWDVSAHQVVHGVTPGVPVEVRAYIKASGGGAARLMLAGFDPLDGDATVASDPVRDSEWKLVTLRATPVNPWIVVSLISARTEEIGYAHFDDVSMTR